MMNIIKQWIKRNWVSLGLIVLMVGMISYHFFGTYNPPIVQPVIVSPVAKDKILPNGQIAQTKVSTPPTLSPIQVGFSEGYVNDTINKILGIKQKEILAINQVQGKYKDSLQLFKSELNDKQKLVKYYQSKDSKGNIVGTAQSTDDGSLVYKGDISLTTVKKKGVVDKRGRVITPDSLIFYDPSQRVTIGQSKEFIYTLPVEPRKKKLRVSPVIGIGTVVPVNIKDSKFNTKEVGLGFFGGFGVSYSF